MYAFVSVFVCLGWEWRHTNKEVTRAKATTTKGVTKVETCLRYAAVASQGGNAMHKGEGNGNNNNNNNEGEKGFTVMNSTNARNEKRVKPNKKNFQRANNNNNTAATASKATTTTTTTHLNGQLPQAKRQTYE